VQDSLYFAFKGKRLFFFISALTVTSFAIKSLQGSSASVFSQRLAHLSRTRLIKLCLRRCGGVFSFFSRTKKTKRARSKSQEQGNKASPRNSLFNFEGGRSLNANQLAPKHENQRRFFFPRSKRCLGKKEKNEGYSNNQGKGKRTRR